MATARGSQHRVTTLTESSYGVTPAITPGDSTVVPVITNTINMTKAIFDDPSIYSDSQKRRSSHGNLAVGGDIGVVYTHTVFDDWLESLMQSTWSTNVLKFGTTNKSFTIERGFLDISQYLVYTGMIANSFSIEITTDGVVQSTFGFIGQDHTVSGTAQDSAPTDATAAEPFIHFNSTFTEGGGSAGCTLVGLSMEVNKNLDQLYCLGTDTIKEPKANMIEVTGTATFYFEDASVYNKFINETESSIGFVLDDGGTESHTFLLPKVKYNTGNVNQNDAGVIPIEMEFVALYDPAEATTLKITRS